MAAKKRILIIENQPLFALGIKKAIDDNYTYSICGTCSDARKSLEIIPRARPDLVILDLSLAVAAGSHITAEILACQPQTRILITIRDMDPSFVKKAKRTGAQGVFSKNQSPNELLSVIRKIFANEKLFAIPQEISSNKKCTKNLPQDLLTSRELEIFEMLGHGLGTRRIAEALAVSPKTIDSHCANLKAKLRARDASELVKQAVIWLTTHNL